MSDDKNIDLSIPFIIPRFSLRGRLVRLKTLNTEILKQHFYPAPIAHVLAELLAAGATLASLLKYEGVFTLQTKTSGPLKLVVIDVTHEGNIRGYAQFSSSEVEKNSSFKDLIGKGYLAFTVDQGLKTDRYQGIVALDHETLPKALEHYFVQSEQLETKIYIASRKGEDDSWKSAALLVQQIPAKNLELFH